MNTELSKEIIGIKALNLLFFNYTTEMLNEMKTVREFNHCWENYVDLKEQTYMQIWEFFLTKISFKSQLKLMEIALKYYGEESSNHFVNAIATEKMLEAHIAKHNSKK